ncbi:sigma-70 family RNA polymerase sigma factor [Streptomyces sp. TRM 70351]|uniref:RNA polymerase sigma factor n=1 Tax=Streptomyces sp. TRM 70351 TaxID=3116552 RepID=UPI002E7B4C3D|nr:sigma-70 family RNA polymerase sigma factor [Streptomyces sp. TRM 70351]MEE1928242.1 sigma-70 family RNA polymerase sigma factor [Streptomyces sp. TRM 70351]
MSTERTVVREEFDAFFARSFSGMLARALLLCGHRQDAEDAVQEAYAEAFRRWERLRGYEAPDAWVYRVVRQRLWAAGRRNARARAAGLDGFPQPVVAGVEQTAEARAVLAALALLPRRQRTVLVMHCLHGMPQEAIARELGLSRGGVAASLFKARRTLEKRLDARERAAEGPSVNRDELVPPGALRGRAAEVRMTAERPDEDRVTRALRVTETWLRGGVAADAEAMARVRAALAAVREEEPEGERGEGHADGSADGRS